MKKAKTPARVTRTQKPATPPKADRSFPAELAAQLEAVIDGDPQGRSTKTLLLRALLREAVKGNLRAIKECLRIVEEVREQDERESLEALKTVGVRKDIDLNAVRQLAAEGMWNQTQIARMLRMTRRTLVRPEHATDVREAIEDGKALWARNHLRLFNEMVRKRKFDPAVLYATKQAPIGWSDKQALVASDGSPVPLEIAGATERLIEAIRRYQERKSTENSSE